MKLLFEVIKAPAMFMTPMLRSTAANLAVEEFAAPFASLDLNSSEAFV
jgi:hypothetical protein